MQKTPSQLVSRVDYVETDVCRKYIKPGIRSGFFRVKTEKKIGLA